MYVGCWSSIAQAHGRGAGGNDDLAMMCNNSTCMCYVFVVCTSLPQRGYVQADADAFMHGYMQGCIDTHIGRVCVYI